MLRIFTVVLLYIAIIAPLKVSSQTIELDSNTHILEKIYKINDTLLIVKVDKFNSRNQLLLASIQTKTSQATQVPQKIFNQYIPGFRWDVDNKYMIGGVSGSGAISEKYFILDEIYFVQKEEWNNPLEYNTISKEAESKTEHMPTGWEKGLKDASIRKKWYDKHLLSRDLTGKKVLLNRELIRSITKNTHKRIYYDFFMQKDHTLTMPMVYNDSLFLYKFSQTYWQQPDYKGIYAIDAETRDFINKSDSQLDKWTQIDSLRCPFYSNFRVAYLDSTMYFITEWDKKNTCRVFSLKNRTFQAIGTITRPPVKPEHATFPPPKPKNPNQPDYPEPSNLFVIDKDQQKIWLMPQVSWQVEPELVQAGKKVPIDLLKSDSKVYTLLAKLLLDPALSKTTKPQPKKK